MKPRTLALASLLALAAVASAQTPPKDLHQVGDHWTAWDPPTSFPEGTQVYTIVPGDTLWDLAAKNLGDPYLWPQIWERNRYILDAHWIYPGDPLLLNLQVEEPEAPTPAETTELETTAPETTAAPEEPAVAETPSRGAIEVGSPSYPFVPLGSADDIYCSGYIGELEEAFPYRLAGSEYEYLNPTYDYRGVREPLQARFGIAETVKYGLYLGDIVYLDQGIASGLQAGDILSAVAPQHVVHHPEGGKPIGRFYAYEGRVLVLAVQENSAIGEIVQSCDPMIVGSTLKPFVAEPVPSERKEPMRPVTDPSSPDAIAAGARIVFAKDGVVTVGQDHVVFIDRGEQEDLFPGDVLTVYRLTARNAPPIVLGEIAILSVQPHTALAKVLNSRYPIYVGDLAIVD